jgi:signal peptidase I
VEPLAPPFSPVAPAAVTSRGFRIAVVLATFAGWSCIGSLVARRWRRAALWVALDWALMAFMVGGALGSHPRVIWMVLGGVTVVHVVAAVDAYRLASRLRTPASLRTLIWCWVFLSIVGFVASWIIRAQLVEAFRTPSASMAPTLLAGDHFFIDKRHRDVRRGDVIAFRYPLDPSVDYVKRVLAVGGDTVELSTTGAISVNGQPLALERSAVASCPAGLPDQEPCEVWRESIDGRSYDVVTMPDRRMRGDQRVVVPEGTFFVVGDNRDNSSDSRIWGPVPLANVKGRALFIWWSSGPGGVRWDRVDTIIE